MKEQRIELLPGIDLPEEDLRSHEKEDGGAEKMSPWSMIAKGIAFEGMLDARMTAESTIASEYATINTGVPYNQAVEIRPVYYDRNYEDELESIRAEIDRLKEYISTRNQGAAHDLP